MTYDDVQTKIQVVWDKVYVLHNQRKSMAFDEVMECVVDSCWWIYAVTNQILDLWPVIQEQSYKNTSPALNLIKSQNILIID
jgi:hypothetical protein